MESKSIFNQTFGLLERAVDLRSLRHSLIVSNIANMDTPNYKAFDLVIEDELRKTGEEPEVRGQRSEVRDWRLNTGNLEPIQRREEVDLVEEATSAASAVFSDTDGNTVDVDREMTKLSENNLIYNALVQVLSKKFDGMQNAIQGSRR